MKLNKKGFTLVELIVVITILAILATVGFISYAGYAAQARDSNRLAAVSMLQKAIEVDSIATWDSVMPDNYIDIKIWNNLVWYQWEAWESVFAKIKYTSWWTDPKYWDYYTYFLSPDRKYAQILTHLETTNYANENIVQLWNTSFANNFENRYPYYKWAGLGILIDENKQPINKLDSAINDDEFDMFSIDNAAREITALFNNTGNFRNKALFIWGQIESRSRKNKILTQDQCPENFILVPGNLDLWQTDFCVGKYEASQNGSSKNNAFITEPWNYPVTSISASLNVIQLCEWNWKWYHTMTFNEWRTIARNIELQSENWSEWIVWEGFIKWWNNGSTITWFNAWWAIAWWPSWNTQQDQLRQLELSNGEIIWDFIWNVREVTQHMNLTNMYGDNLNPFYTYNHSKYLSLYETLEIDWLALWDKVSWADITDTNYQNNYGPLTSYDVTTWVGMLYYPSNTDIRYFLTWWDYSVSSSTEYENWLFSIWHLQSTSYPTTWIRCAYIPN